MSLTRFARRGHFLGAPTADLCGMTRQPHTDYYSIRRARRRVPV
jgi:hypothetical protein